MKHALALGLLPVLLLLPPASLGALNAPESADKLNFVLFLIDEARSAKRRTSLFKEISGSR